MACCPGCKFGEECARNGVEPVPIQSFADEAAVAGGASSAGPFTFLDATIDCRVKDYDPRVSKTFTIIG